MESLFGMMLTTYAVQENELFGELEVALNGQVRKPKENSWRVRALAYGTALSLAYGAGIMSHDSIEELVLPHSNIYTVEGRVFVAGDGAYANGYRIELDNGEAIYLFEPEPFEQENDCLLSRVKVGDRFKIVSSEPVASKTELSIADHRIYINGREITECGY